MSRAWRAPTPRNSEVPERDCRSARIVRSFAVPSRRRHSPVGAGHAREQPRLQRMLRAWRAPTPTNSEAPERDCRSARIVRSFAVPSRRRHSPVGAGHAREQPRLQRMSRAWRAPTPRNSEALDWEWRKVRSSESGAGSDLRRAYMSGIAGSDPGHTGRRGTGMYPAPVAANRSPLPARGCCHLHKAGRVRPPLLADASVENRFPLLDKGHHRFAMFGRLVGERLVAGG